MKLERENALVKKRLKGEELESGDSPLLIFIAAQATLGIVKDARAGTCRLKDYNDDIQMYALKGSML